MPTTLTLAGAKGGVGTTVLAAAAAAHAARTTGAEVLAIDAAGHLGPSDLAAALGAPARSLAQLGRVDGCAGVELTRADGPAQLGTILATTRAAYVIIDAGDLDRLEQLRVLEHLAPVAEGAGVRGPGDAGPHRDPRRDRQVEGAGDVDGAESAALLLDDDDALGRGGAVAAGVVVLRDAVKVRVGLAADEPPRLKRDAGPRCGPSPVPRASSGPATSGSTSTPRPRAGSPGGRATRRRRFASSRLRATAPSGPSGRRRGSTSAPPVRPVARGVER